MPKYKYVGPNKVQKVGGANVKNGDILEMNFPPNKNFELVGEKKKPQTKPVSQVAASPVQVKEGDE